MSTINSAGTNAFLEQIDAPIASFLSSCVHCGLCAEACLFYTETGDPKYTPIRTLEPLRRIWQQHYTIVGRLAAMTGLAKPVTDEELDQWQELLYDSCTLCGRCSMVCPVGNDIAYMIRKSREGMCASGHAPEDLVSAARMAIDTGSPMGVKLKTLQAQLKHVTADTGIEVPMDVEGADYMLLLSSMEVVNYPEFLGAIATIFKQAGVSWTLSSEAFEATNVGIQIGASDIARELVSRAVNAAEKLKVKHLISPECGHAYTAIRWEGPNLMGRPYKFRVVHILELLDQLLREGRLQLKEKEKRQLTFHDPCQIVRRGGVVEPPRNLMNAITDDFVEMVDGGVLNWCCGGGGGVSRLERAEPLRTRVFNKKKKQLEEIGVKTMVTACANCRIVLEEGLEENNMVDYEVLGITELLAEHLQTES
jgi:Fe-S oxidoreductase